MKMRQFALFMAVSALMTGCATLSGSPPPDTPQSTATAASAAGPTNAPVSEAGAVEAARRRLTKNGMENPNLVSVVQVTPMTWSDDCLDLPSSLACHSAPTPGYVIELERGGQRYLVHTDHDGKQARLARSPAESPTDVFIRWKYSDGKECRAAVIGTDRMQYGTCGEAMLDASSMATMWPDVSGQSQASYLRRTYAPFTANTARGSLVFSGTGATVASQAEQRAIAEWALTRFVDATNGYLSADYSLRLNWQEKSASLCGGLWVYEAGLAVVWNCDGSAALAVSFLPPTRLQQFYEWLDSGKRWEVVRDVQGQGSRPSLSLHFSSGDTGQNATAEDTEQVLWFAREVYTMLPRQGDK